jgi:hypothetical protein
MVLVVGMVATMMPLFAADDVSIAAVADTTATAVPQDGDNSVKTTLATCAARCDRNPRGARDAVLEFAVTSVPANAINVRARLQVFAWREFAATITAHQSARSAREARPVPDDAASELDAVGAVVKGYNEWDVSELVRGNGTFTISLRQSGYETRIYWASKEHRNDSIRPRLLVSYDVSSGVTTAENTPTPAAPEPASTPTPTPTPTPPPPSPSPDVKVKSDPAQEGECGSVSAKLVPSCGAWWGMYSPTSDAEGWDHGRAVADIERQVGRKFDLVHRYHDFSNSGSNGAFPDEFEQQQMREGRLMFFAWESRVFSSGTVLRWADVYGGDHDATIDAVAGRIKAAGVPVFMGFDHEPEDEPAKGSDAEFVRAWRYVYDRFTRAGATNAVWVWTMMGWPGYYDRYVGLYPGDAYVDWVGYDPYNFYACNGGKTWKSPATTVGGFYKWLDDNKLGVGKPRMLAEFGTNFNTADASAKRRWFERFPAAVKAHPKIKAVVYFNSAGSTTTSGNCNMTMNHDPSAIAGFTKAGKDPYFRQPVQIPE